jgi:transcriptional regulator of acetoin/glycerol metabolism
MIAVSPPDKKSISDKDLKSHLIWHDSSNSSHLVLSLDQLEKHAIERALRQSKGNKSKASKLLGISRDTLYRKLKEYNIDH